MTSSRIYMDHNATTPMCVAAYEAMRPYWLEHFGNPSSIHAEGRRARDAVEAARREVAALLGARPDEIVFTSGGTESDNLAVLGAARAQRARGRHRVVSSPLEHPAVRGALAVLAAEGFEVRDLPVRPDGTLALEAPGDLAAPAAPSATQDSPATLAAADAPATPAALIGERTALVTLALANHEIGNVYPVASVAERAHRAGALVHTDAVQAVGRLPVDVGALGVDLLSLSGHKFGGPKGVGALFVRRGLDLPSLIVGGHQERERRAGTENVAAVVGLGAAATAARIALEGGSPARIARLRDRLEAGLLTIPGARRFGAASDHPADRPAPDPGLVRPAGTHPGRVPGTLNVGFHCVDGELVVMALDLEGVAVSTGAACTSGSLAPSAVILALGVDRATARTAVRFSLGPGNTEPQIDAVTTLVETIVARIRSLAP